MDTQQFVSLFAAQNLGMHEFESLGVSQLYAHAHTMPSRIHRCPCWQWIDRWQQRRTSLFGTPHLKDNVGSVSCISRRATSCLLALASPRSCPPRPLLGVCTALKAPERNEHNVRVPAQKLLTDARGMSFQ